MGGQSWRCLHCRKYFVNGKAMRDHQKATGHPRNPDDDPNGYRTPPGPAT